MWRGSPSALGATVIPAIAIIVWSSVDGTRYALCWVSSLALTSAPRAMRSRAAATSSAHAASRRRRSRSACAQGVARAGRAGRAGRAVRGRWCGVRGRLRRRGGGGGGGGGRRDPHGGSRGRTRGRQGRRRPGRWSPGRERPVGPVPGHQVSRMGHAGSRPVAAGGPRSTRRSQVAGRRVIARTATTE